MGKRIKEGGDSKQEKTAHRKISSKVKSKTRKPKTEQQIVERMRKRCVQLAKDISKERDGWRCCYCKVGKPQRRMHSHHFFHEGLYKSMSADIDNLITLCAMHHQGGFGWKSHDTFNFHNTPAESTQWFIDNYPERYAALKERTKTTQQLNMLYWNNKYLELCKTHLTSTQSNSNELSTYQNL